MNIIDAVAGGTPTLLLNIVDENTPANNPVTGQTATVAIRRQSDGKWYDFVAAIWDTFASYALIEASNKQALTDKADGSYSYAWNHQAADAGATADYTMIYAVPSGTYQGMAHDMWRFRPDVARDDQWTDTKAGYIDASVAAANNGTPPTAQAIATYVWVTNVTGAAVAACLAGITSLAKWLGIIAGKTADAPTLAEVNATTAGAGYNNLTDSHEALRDTVPMGSTMVSVSGLATTTEVGAVGTAVGNLNDLTAQEVANALKLAPAAGNPAAGSVNADLDVLVAAAGGTGQIPVTVTVTDGTDPQAGVIGSLNSTATGAVVAGPLVTDEDGVAVFNMTAGQLLTATPTTTPFLSGGSTAFTVGAVATAVTCAMVAAALPVPAPAGYCAVRCVDRTYTPAAATGTFSLEKGISPTTVDAGGVTVMLVDGPEAVSLSGGIGTLNLLQEAVVLVKVRTAKGTTYRKIEVPAVANADLWDIPAL